MGQMKENNDNAGLVDLKPTDKKLLAQLYSDSRENYSKIAKSLNLSREQVSYRIKKFESERVVKGYGPIVNYGRLGYQVFVLVLFKFNTQRGMKKFKEKIKKSKNRILTVEALANYDLGVLFIFKDDREKNEYLSDLVSSNSSEVRNYLVIEPYLREMFPLKFLGDKRLQPSIFHEYRSEEYKLEGKEKNILSVLNKNSNARIIDIAKETNLSAELIVYKLRKLKKENVFITSRAYFDMEKIGYFYSILLINIHNFSKQNQEKMRKFAKENSHIDSLMMMAGKPNCYIQMFHKDVSEMHQTLRKLKENFKNDSLGIEILPLKNEGEDINLIPFL